MGDRGAGLGPFAPGVLPESCGDASPDTTDGSKGRYATPDRTDEPLASHPAGICASPVAVSGS